jgi:hypothetical protein
MKTGKSPTTYGYAEPSAFERLMLLIATLVQHPGVGGSGKEVPKNNKHRDALQEVLISLQKVAHAQGFLPPQCSVHTLRKDLETLRYWGILEQRMYRWGYYLGTGGLNRKELQAALNALACQAIAQQDPQMSKIYHTVSRKLKGMELSGDLFYPVRTQLDRVIIHTEPEELIAKGLHKYTLFHAWSRKRFYGEKRSRSITIVIRTQRFSLDIFLCIRCSLFIQTSPGIYCMKILIMVI